MKDNEAPKASMPFSFFALDPYLENNIESAEEKQGRGADYLTWGPNNRYPNYIEELYNGCPTLHSIVDGSVDYTSGDDVTLNVPVFGKYLNHSRMTAREFVRTVALDAYLYSGFALQVISRKDGAGVAEVYPIPLRYLRTDKEREVFYYSEDWGKKYVKMDKVDRYPAFIPGTSAPTSILFVKLSGTGVYPSPCFAAATKACEMERDTDEYHLNALHNGFVSSYVMNFNNGTPPDQIKEEIEAAVREKFTGYKNAGRPMISWNNDRTHSTTVTPLEVQDYGEKYQSLAKHSRQQIFCSFRAIPAIFGIMTETTGFSEQEFSDAFKLYNRTRIQPVQDAIVDALDYVLGTAASLTITPFSLERAQGVVE